ncbi:hypothetical protein Tco_1500119 [Tanacetum coccineum]
MILTTNTPYPSRKIRRIRAYTHQRPQGKEGQYVVSREDQYAILDIWHVNILEDIKRGNGYPRKGQKSKPKRQNRARERKKRKEKSKSKPSQEVKVNKVKSKSTPGTGF